MLRCQMMDIEPAAAGEQHGLLEHCLVVERHRHGRHRDVGALEALPHGGDEGRFDGVDLVEGQGAPNLDVDIEEQGRTGRPHPDLAHPEHARRQLRCLLDDRDGAFGRGIEQARQGALPEPQGRQCDEAGHHQGGDRIGGGQSVPDQQEADDDRGRAPHVGAEMQGVGGKRFAGMGLRRLAQRPRAVPIDYDRTDDDGDGPPGHRDIVLAGDQARQRPSMIQAVVRNRRPVSISAATLSALAWPK